MRSFVKLPAGVSVCKVPDAEAVGGVQLAHEELAAGLSYRGHLEDRGGWQQDLGEVISIKIWRFPDMYANL